MNPQITHCCEAPRSMLSNYFGKKQVLRGTFGKIWHIQIQIHPRTYYEPKYGEFNLKNKVSANGLLLVDSLTGLQSSSHLWTSRVEGRFGQKYAANRYLPTGKHRLIKERGKGIEKVTIECKGTKGQGKINTTWNKV